MRIGSATGMQTAFFTFALLLLIVPVSYQVKALHPWSHEEWTLIDKALPFMVIVPVLFGFPRLRRACRWELARAIPRDRRTEVFLASICSISKAFAWAGLCVLWWWLSGGPLLVENKIAALDGHDVYMQRATHLVEWVRAIVLVGFLGPVLEELVFRGFLYRAWARQWGWIPATLLTSTVFALYHPNFVPAFTASLLYVCLYRRTGTLWAPIVAHAAFNTATYYPFLGQFVFQRYHDVAGDISSWGFHLACLLFIVLALPIYLWMSRDSQSRVESKRGTTKDGALPT